METLPVVVFLPVIFIPLILLISVLFGFSFCFYSRNQIFHYLLLNLEPGIQISALKEHLMANTGFGSSDNIELKGDKAILESHHRFTCNEWSQCEKFRGHRLTLVQLISKTKLWCSSSLQSRIGNANHSRNLKFKQISMRDKVGNKTDEVRYKMLEVEGDWLNIALFLDNLTTFGQPHYSQKQEEKELTCSLSYENEYKKPLLQGSYKQKEPERLKKRQNIKEDDSNLPQCDKQKTDLLEIDNLLYSYLMEHCEHDLHCILDPKPFSYSYRSGSLVLTGQACMVSKAAEDLADFCQKLTPKLGNCLYTLLEGIDREAFKTEAGRKIVQPAKMLILPSDGNTFILYGPKDRLPQVKYDLKNLEREFMNRPGHKSSLSNFGSGYPVDETCGNPSARHLPAPVEMRVETRLEGVDREAFKTEALSDFKKEENSEDRRMSFPKSGQQIGNSKRDSDSGTGSQVNNDKIRVTVLTGDLREQPTDVIVNPSNQHLKHGGGAAKAIANAAGPQLFSECHQYIEKNGHLMIGQVMHTTAGNLRPRIKYVIHAAGPSEKIYSKRKDLEEKLEETFFNCLKHANDVLHARSISIPAISSGAFGVSKDLVANAALAALREFEEERTGAQRILEKVCFVNIDDESTAAFSAAFGIKQPCRTSTECLPEKAGGIKTEKTRSKSTDPPKRIRALVQKHHSSSSVKDLAQENDASTGSQSAAISPTRHAFEFKKVDAREIGVAAASNTPDSEDCVICMEAMTNPKALPCGHKFCEECIKDSFEKCQPKCPSCGRLFGVMRGNQPPGNMKVSTIKTSLNGYERYKTLVVEYFIPSGTQNDTHPNPGQPYTGTSRTAYLPDSREGREVCELLKKAFNAGLIFTVGRSTTSGRDNQVVWNDIHHKTSEIGPYGYPDPNYLSRVKDELKAKGIVSGKADFRYEAKQSVI